MLFAIFVQQQALLLIKTAVNFKNTHTKQKGAHAHKKTKKQNKHSHKTHTHTQNKNPQTPTHKDSCEGSELNTGESSQGFHPLYILKLF